MESVQRIEPALLETPPPDIADAVAELAAGSAVLGRSLHPRTASNLAGLVRTMNAYYSNLIEGHNTRPRDIERALAGDFDRDPDKRKLQVEAASHIRVQAEVDRLAAERNLPDPVSANFIRRLHRGFYEDAPPELLRVRGAGREILMSPGHWRSSPDEEVAVGRHLPPASDRVPDFMDYFERRYQLATMGAAAKIIAVAAAHHRFNYIHPFPDGNGRVSRLMSHAMGYSAGIAAHGLVDLPRVGARSREPWRVQDVDGPCRHAEAG
jgi:Fic family protein